MKFPGHVLLFVLTLSIFTGCSGFLEEMRDDDPKANQILQLVPLFENIARQPEAYDLFQAVCLKYLGVTF